MKFHGRGCLVAPLIGLALLVLTAARAQEQTALDRYVAAPDPTYSYRLLNTVRGKGFQSAVLEMTSQTWLSEKEVDRPVWKHWLTIVRPETVDASTALLLIGSGANTQAAPAAATTRLVEISRATRSVVAELRMVPNQPLRFAGDGRERTEDALIAWTWDRYLRTGDERWPARLPMTKAAVRAMDTISSFCAGEEGGNLKVDSFVVTGASKRGWTTWTTAAVDRRVIAIIPIVIDTLNLKPSAIHGFEAYGFWAPAIRDYIDMGLQNWFGKPQYDALLRIEDPYEYRQRLTMPKFIINAAGDQFFVPDSSQFYFDGLPGTKYLRYVPNADHSLRNSDAAETLLACYQAVLAKKPLPQFAWTLADDGTFRVETRDQPSEVRVWRATNPRARDFRLQTLGPAWRSELLTPREANVYLAETKAPPSGWTAHFVELTYKIPGLTHPLKFTTQVKVVPDVLPFKFPTVPGAGN